jgi:hypothetical protein
MSDQTAKERPVDMELLEKIYAQFQAHAATVNQSLGPLPQTI